MTMPPVEAVLFDADGVVQRSGSGFRDGLTALYPQRHRAEAFLAELFEAERACLVGAAELEDRLGAVLKRWNVAEPVADVLRLWELIEPCPEVLAMADELGRRGVRVGLATNQQSFRARYMTETLGYGTRFEALFYSHEIGHVKPSPRFFQRVVEALALDPGRVLLIDDSEANVTGAREAGLQAATYELGLGPAALAELLAASGLLVPEQRSGS
jgi:putative hydrolase of the HAD superfamily